MLQMFCGWEKCIFIFVATLNEARKVTHIPSVELISITSAISLAIRFLLYFFFQFPTRVNKIIYTYTRRGNIMKLYTFSFKLNKE